MPLGYLGDADKTARTFPVIDGVRYSVPGDRARWRGRRRASSCSGRDSVTINSGGEKIFAEEVEQAIAQPPGGVRRGRGRPAERALGPGGGGRSCSCAEGATVTDDELLDECAKPHRPLQAAQGVRVPAGTGPLARRQGRLPLGRRHRGGRRLIPPPRSSPHGPPARYAGDTVRRWVSDSSPPTGSGSTPWKRDGGRSSCSCTASRSAGGRGAASSPAGPGRLPGGGCRPPGLRPLRQARCHLRRAVANACLAGVVTALGAERCVIVGHDWGGLLVWPFARRYPELLAGVVGVNTPDLPRPPMAPTALLRMAFPDEPPYLVQFQDRGPAEYILGRDVRGVLRGHAPRAGHPPYRSVR